MTSGIGSRIKELREKKNFTQADLAKEFGVTDKSVSYWEKQGVKDKKLIQRIADYFGVSLEFLKNGMPEPAQIQVQEPKAAYGRGGMPLVVTVDRAHEQENIEMVETRAAAGYIEHRLEPEYIKDLPKLYFPGSEFRNATFRCFQVQGDSMSPGLQNGDFVIASYVHNWPTNIQEGYVYVVVTRHDIVVKRLLNRVEQRGKVVIQSDNEAWATDEIPAEDIIELWRAKAKISFKFPNMRYDTAKKIANLEADVFELRQMFQNRNNPTIEK